MNVPKNQPFAQAGGARIGRSHWLSLNATIPFATLEATRTEITIKLLNRSYVLPRGSIDSIWISTGPLSTGVQIEHHESGQPKHIVFWTPDADAIRSNLRRLGYETR